MKILTTGLKKAVNESKLLYITAFIVSLIVLIPISNFLIEGFNLIVRGDFSIGLSGSEEILGTVKLLFFTSLFGGEILKDSKLVEYQIDMKKIIKRGVIVGVGDGIVKVDGKEIYVAEGLKVGLIK